MASAPWLLWAKKSIGCVGVHAIRLNSWTGTKSSPVSSLKCDRRQRLNLESCLTAVCVASGILIVPSHAGCVTALGLWPAGWPACYRLAHGCPTGVQGGGGGPAYRAAVWLGARETKLDLKLGALLNTVQGCLLPTHYAHTQTHTHTQGCAMGLPTWPWRCGLIACPVSGVEWSDLGEPVPEETFTHSHLS